MSFQVAGAAEALVTNLNDEKQKKEMMSEPCRNPPVNSHLCSLALW